MASVFTIAGADLGKPVGCHRAKDGKDYAIDDCIEVKNRRTRCAYKMCCVGRAKSPLTGWAFKEDSYSCPGRPKRAKRQ